MTEKTQIDRKIQSSEREIADFIDKKIYDLTIEHGIVINNISINIKKLMDDKGCVIGSEVDGVSIDAIDLDNN